MPAEKTLSISLKSRFLSSVGWLGFSKLITQVGTWSATIVIARLLTPGDYGLVGMAGLITGIVALLGDFGLGSSVVRKRDISKEEISSLFYIIAGIGLLVMLIMNLVAPLGAIFFKEGEVTNLIRLSSVAFLINSLAAVPVSLLQKEMKFKKIGLIESFSALSASILTIILAWQKFGAYSLIFGTISNALIRVVVLFSLTKFPISSFSMRGMKSHLRFGSQVTIERYLWYYYTNIDYLLAGKFLGKSPYGIYSMAYQLAYVPVDKLASIVNPVSFSTFSQITEKDELIRIYFKILRYVAFIFFPIFSGLFWVADDFFPLLLGDKWRASIFVFKVLCFVCMLSCLAIFNSPLLYSVNRTDIGIKNMFIGSLVATVAFFIGIHWGLKGLALSWLIMYPFLFAIYIYNVSRALRFKLLDYILNLKYPIIVSGLMSACILLFQVGFNNLLAFHRHLSVIRLLLTILIGIGSYLLLSFILNRETVRESIEIIKKRKI